MAGPTRRLPTLRGEAIHCPAQAVAVNGLSRKPGPVEVCRWRQGITPRGGSKGGACKPLIFSTLTIPQTPMPDSPPPETLAWLRHAASCGQRDAQLTLHILERLEALEQRPIPGAVELAALAPEPAPVAAPAGGLVERVAEKMGPQSQAAMDAGELPYGAARAAIREVAAAARERIAPFDPNLKWGDVAQWLKQEADR